MLLNQNASDRPDIVSRVFNFKLKELLDDLLERHVLGHVTAFVYTIEFQKRVLPHGHMVLFLGDADKLCTAQDVYRLVSAEIPDPQAQPEFYETVKRHMMHDPCGHLDPQCVCMQIGECKKNFPNLSNGKKNSMLMDIPCRYNVDNTEYSYNRCQKYMEQNTFLRLSGVILIQLVLILNRPFK